jgi:hypothetical protein
MQTLHVVLVGSADYLANPTRLGDNLAGLVTVDRFYSAVFFC